MWVGALATDAPAASVAPAVAQGEQPVALHFNSRSWIDGQGGYRIAEIEAAGESLPWRARRPDQTDRIDGKALWIQFDVQQPSAERWFVEVGAAGIDRVQLFHRSAAGEWVMREAGDALPTATWPVPGRYPTFVLPRTGAQPMRYWMRVENSRLDFAAPLTLYPEHQLLAKRDRDQFLLGAYFGIAALVALAALISGILWRDRAFRAFALYITVVGASQLARAGVGAEHVWPDWPYWNDLAVFAWPGLPVAAALWFVRLVTEPARLSRSLDTIVWGLVAAVLLAVAADAVLRTRLSMVMVLSLTGVSLAALVAMVVWGWVDGRDRDLRLVALGFLPVVVLALFPLARAFNLIPVTTLTRNAIFFGTLLQLPILYYALQVRSLRRRESEVRAAALSHADALTGLPHRRSFLERLETTLARARSQKQRFAVLGVRVANLEQLVEEFGPDSVDKALVVAASHLRRVITDVDMAARVGDRDFALLLEGPLEGPTAVSRAQQVVASGLRQTAALPAAATLKFHVTVGLAPHNDHDAHATLQWLLDGLDQITPDAKKAIRALNF